MRVRAFVPYHITGFWFPVETGDPLTTGSYGAGIVLESGVVVEFPSSVGIELDPTSRLCMEILGVDPSVSRYMGIYERYRVGEGYGASAARSLAIALVCTALRGLSTCRAGKAAHIAEVLMGTGYADVIAEFVGGGLVYRVKPGAPCIGIAESIPLPRLAIVTSPLGYMTTQEMHRVYGEAIRIEGMKAWNRFIEKPSLETFLEIAYSFSKAVGFLTTDLDEKVREALSKHLSKGMVLGYYVKKRVLTVVLEPSAVEDVVAALRVMGFETRVDWVGRKGIEVVIE